MATVKYIDGAAPNDPTKQVELVGYSWGRGKVLPVAHKVANIHGGHGQGIPDPQLKHMNEAGKRLLDSALK